MKNNRNLSYQNNAIEYGINHLMDNSKFTLQAPTGSGKTFIISKLIQSYLENYFLNNFPTTFIFIAPSTGKLDYQGYQKFNDYLKNNWVHGYNVEYIGSSNSKSKITYLDNIDYFKPNTVYFFGWALFKKTGRINLIDSEKNNIYRVIDNTKLKNIKIVLIIDEAHREVKLSSQSTNAKSLFIEALKPFKIINVSATINSNQDDIDYKITYDDVREECAIKKNVNIISSNYKVDHTDKYDENQLLILSAINKQKDIRAEYFKNKININPLILIQVPDETKIDNRIDSKKILINQIIEFLEKHNYKKGINLAIWLDKYKTHEKNEILSNDSQVEILIFKQAIATGWDIPRANILVRIRDAKVDSFNIQTLGRILRNPLFEYYNNELIDDAYVFSKDEKYMQLIKNESIVSDEQIKINVKKSNKSKKSNFSINKILIHQNKYNEDELIELVSNKIIKNEGLLEFMNYENPLISDSKYSSDIDNLNVGKMNSSNQLSIKYDLPNLLNIYIKFKTITKSNELINKILDSISKKMGSINIKIKDFYLACIHNWKSPHFNYSGGKIELKKLIEMHIDEYVNKETTYKCETYKLPDEYQIPKDMITEWDNVNSYEIGININKWNLNKNEEKFYSRIKHELEDTSDPIHIFRNGTNPKYDYYVEYIDQNQKIRKFFPDFIIINDNTKKVYIFEQKGVNEFENIDRNSDKKFDTIKEYIHKNLLNSSYKCTSVYKCILEDDENEFIDITGDNKLKKFNYIMSKIKEPTS